MRRLGLGLGGLAIALVFTGCSTSLKEYNPKMGLLDILARMQPANHSGDLARESSAEPVEAGAFPIPPRGTRPATGLTSQRSIAHSPQVTLEWPLRRVEITSAFGRRGREFHEGIDLRARPGTPVYASHAGQVLYSGERIRGYGEMIVLRHSSGLATIYAHNSKLVVHRGEWVRQGELIAYTGETGDARGPHLHFEVREGINAVNPLHFLPRPGRRALAMR